MNSVGVTEDAEQNPKRAGSPRPCAEQNTHAKAVPDLARSKIPARKQSPTLRGAKSRRESSSQLFAEQNPDARAVRNPARSKNPDARAVPDPARSIFQYSTAMSATKNKRRMNGQEHQKLKNKDGRTVGDVEN
ncbi:hypothetical protein HMPREF0658_0132 [Hoylesella marshii DSM 16973 = JCM 13450]|uniref:Uncharacterized protein n=1 Tax=Hoylesella marshii DSM 16973 = JCM 13450 TaxID=862515 RepID=E0NPN1_9BACT|nr:hypothetical protein HMPREF0658_0132 [Hoylesella marshii DSM 16973 = JCM 13450]